MGQSCGVVPGGVPTGRHTGYYTLVCGGDYPQRWSILWVIGLVEVIQNFITTIINGRLQEYITLHESLYGF